MNRTMIKSVQTTLFALLATIVLSGCVKDELHYTPHPEKGALKVRTDWAGLTDDAKQPESYMLKVGNLLQAVSGIENTLNTLLSEGKYTLLVYNTPHGVTIDNTVATVNELPDGTLEPIPDYLFLATKECVIIKDDTLKVNVKMQQSIRTLQLVLKINDADMERIVSTSADFTGVAHSINLSTGRVDATGVGKVVIPTFRRGSFNATNADAQLALIANMRLAGMVSEIPQKLNLMLTLTDGSVMSIETDLTELLTEFNNDIKPMTLDATITFPDNPHDVGATGTITDWEVVDNGNITIH